MNPDESKSEKNAGGVFSEKKAIFFSLLVHKWLIPNLAIFHHVKIFLKILNKFKKVGWFNFIFSSYTIYIIINKN